MTSADSRLAAASNEIRVRVESSKNRLTTVRPRSVGSFLIGRSAERGHLLGGVEDEHRRRRGSGRRRTAGVASSAASLASAVGRPEQRPRRGRRTRSSSTLDRLAQRGRQVLADEVGADRQLAVAAVDQDGELDRRAAGRRRSSASRAARMVRPEKSTSSTSTTTLPSMPPAGIVGALQRAGRLQPQVVAVHRDVERADRDLGRPRPRRCAAASRRASGDAAGGDARAGRGRRRPCCARGSRGRCGSAPGRCRRRRGRCGHRASRTRPAGHRWAGRWTARHPCGPPSPPHRTGR